MDDFTTQALAAANTQSSIQTGSPSRRNNAVSSPIAVAGLADTVRKAIDGMARAKVSADVLNAKAQRLVGNIANVDAIARELDSANEQLEAAVASVGVPLEGSDQGGESGAKNEFNTDATGTSGVAPPSSVAQSGIVANSPEHGIKLSLNAVTAQ
jgi:hypothetical protein